MKLDIIPQPQKISFGSGWFVVPARGVVGITDHSLYSLAQSHKKILGEYPIGINRSGLKYTFCLGFARDLLKSEAYRLEINRNGIKIEGGSTRGVFYGMQTLRQIIEQFPGGHLPVLRIDDWPDFADRGVYYDVSRGRVPRLERLKELADTLAKYKINQLQLYTKHTFAFRGHPAIGQGASPLTADDILELDAYCRERYIELVPSFPSFGHLETVLMHPQYHHLAEDWGKCKYVTPDPEIRQRLETWRKGRKIVSFGLSPANPETYVFLDSLYSEFLPLFSSGWFNACCDETYDLGYGQSYKLCQKIGRGRLYLNHIIMLNELSQKYGKKMMFWGDIIRHYPELIPEIPKDVTVLDWGYEHNHNFNAIRDFKKAGLAFYACPSTASYNALFPSLPKAMANIAGFAAAAFKHGGQGLLNTDWGDGGGCNFMEYSWHGFLFGAEQAWNTGADQGDFTTRFCRLFLKTSDPQMARALTELGEINYPNNIWRNIYFANADKSVFPLGTRGALFTVNGTLKGRQLTFDADFGRRITRRLEWIRSVFTVHGRRQGEDPLEVLPYWVFAVDTLRHAASKVVLMGAKENNTASARRKLAGAMETLQKRFQNLWLARNRSAEIRNVLVACRRSVRALRENRLGVKTPPPGCISRILVSRSMPGAGNLHSLTYPVNRKNLDLKIREFGSSAYGGCLFYDLHDDIFNCASRDVLVYFACPFNCPKPMKLNLCLGYDGPVKVWIDGKLVLHDPQGRNPATPDKAIIPFDAASGEHEALIALGSNRGKAWGLFLRFYRRKAAQDSRTAHPACLPQFIA